ncbi:TPA: hypothetical protein RPW15_001664 [Campylobacter fetus subsp. venerealis]|uniref:Uncharacterized protein n=1 Tax=Campylobacter fetus subsp. venerealis NCTC 10354 TaxID=983328 RepID=A0AAE6IY28_CAMFE|nr:hypothetical protein [Campylobacter fetus]OCS25427.1 hypothetical protein CFVB10_08495 [Campylobacter fetus subsp. venerealis cfvB10]OCS29096.1 hypothetical protein CFVCCUG33900_08325 [Campylobacter fetus subsp. venerealis LMG 6570 = CCUG 33900]AIR80130.1 hypothetical protein CFV97608_0466 [Campylobacter fetus subsp. venerealis 97/608]EAK0836125.1 hypothetical protein [Campylobacter fetus]EGU23654.1 Hypothetical protein CFV354_0570 [Campylobacter fetus subsp. venerealis NCTC 10354]
MAVLNNGLQTMELGATAWRIIINDNFTKLYTKNEIDTKLSGGNTEISAKKLKVANVELSGGLQASGELGQIAGFLEVKINGEVKKIPYYS